jgi:hypothetical protein
LSALVSRGTSISFSAKAAWGRARSRLITDIDGSHPGLARIALGGAALESAEGVFLVGTGGVEWTTGRCRNAVTILPRYHTCAGDLSRLAIRFDGVHRITGSPQSTSFFLQD